VSETGGLTSMRLDKWLWAARFYRTRSLAAQAIEAGHVRVDGERVKPAQSIREGTRVSVRKQELAWEVEVMHTSLRRGPAAEAALLYRERPESVAARELALGRRRAARALDVPSGRPTKRDRRRLEDFLNEP
jgi:ribosome-associated heat shock protein Hsp15